MKIVSIVTVNFNQPKVTADLLRSIREVNTYPALEVIVVDNGSHIDPVPEWKKEYPDIVFLRSEENLGFAGGNNLGIREAKGDYLFLINNDTEVTTDLVALLVATMETSSKIGILSPKIRYFDQPGMLQYAGYTPMNYFLARNHCVGQFETDRGQYDQQAGRTGYAHGAAMMVRRKAIEAAGPMNENYFLYYEELDWCENIRRAGYEIYTDLNAIIYHKESISVGKRSALKEYFMTRNRILFIRRNAPGLRFFIFCTYFLFTVVPRNVLLYIKNGEYAFIPVFFRAIAWHFSNGVNSTYLGFKINPTK